ncbi:MAG: nicotinamide mononucleotide transporter [Flavobacteriales bacterium]|nr:nicotinamide mononucleotide transporter [Flavobacteriales bacterium]
MIQLEWIAMLTGVLAVVLLYLNNILTWPLGFINIVCLMYVFWYQKLYGDFVVQILFLTIGIWGWWNWKRADDRKPGILKPGSRIKLVIFTLSSIPLTFYYLKNHTDCSFPFMEASILNISIFGQWLTAKKLIENWLYWLVADAMMIWVYAMKDLEVLSGYALILFFLGISGWIRWNRMIKQTL